MGCRGRQAVLWDNREYQTVPDRPRHTAGWSPVLDAENVACVSQYRVSFALHGGDSGARTRHARNRSSRIGPTEGGTHECLRLVARFARHPTSCFAISRLCRSSRTRSARSPRTIHGSSISPTQIERIAGRVLVTSGRQRELTEEIQEADEAGSPGDARRVDRRRSPRRSRRSSSDWRDAERRLERHGGTAPRGARGGSARRALRDEYRAASRGG